MTEPVHRKIAAIFFDMNGTLRQREAHEPTQRAAYARLQKLLGKEAAPQDWWDELTRRQKAYSHWAQEQQVQLSEQEIWSRWILPEVPSGQIEPLAAELMLAWSERKGRTLPKPQATETLTELKQRGYHLGVISNSMSTLDIPRSLVAFGWEGLFETVILSAEIKFRKPSPQPFLHAARTLGVPPEQCAFLGNRIAKDIVGCKRAGFALGIVLEPAQGPRPDDQDPTFRADAIIHCLPELLELFP